MPDPQQPPPPRRRAAALHYDAPTGDGSGDRAPRVTAVGAGLVADRIIEAAREAGVPVRHDPALAQALSALDLGTEIPEPLYRAVAEALAWAYRLDAQLR